MQNLAGLCARTHVCLGSSCCAECWWVQSEDMVVRLDCPDLIMECRPLIYFDKTGLFLIIGPVVNGKRSNGDSGSRGEVCVM